MLMTKKVIIINSYNISNDNLFIMYWGMSPTLCER